MRYVVILSVLAMAIFVACEKRDVTISSNEYILFSSPMIEVESEGRSTFLEQLEPNTSFGVMGYCVPFQPGTTNPDWAAGTRGWGNIQAYAHPDVFCQQKVNYDGAVCKYDNPKKWYNTEEYPSAVNAENFRYTFFAYYPYDCFNVTPTDPNTIGSPKFVFSMPFQEGDNGSLNDEQIQDAMLAVEYDHQRSQGNVIFNFSHILVGLGFQVNNYNENEDIVVTSVTLSGAFTRSMTIDFSKQPQDKGFYSCSGTYSGTYTIFTGEEKVTPGSSWLVGDKHLLLLSDAVGGTYFGTDVKIRIEYTYNGKKQYFETGRPSTFTPQAGTRYTAQLNFVGDTFVLNFVVDNNGYWEDGGDSDITIK